MWLFISHVYWARIWTFLMATSESNADRYRLCQIEEKNTVKVLNVIQKLAICKHVHYVPELCPDPEILIRI